MTIFALDREFQGHDRAGSVFASFWCVGNSMPIAQSEIGCQVYGGHLRVGFESWLRAERVSFFVQKVAA
jgi:hypothetical protein